MRPEDLTARELASHYGLEPLPLEGGLFRRTWVGPRVPGGRAAGSAIVVLLSAEDDQFSALHRLPADEVWHFYLGDPVELLLLEPNGSALTMVLGHDVLGGQQVQFTVPGGTWMGGKVAEGGCWALLGCTMAPGFVPADYEGADADQLCARYPQAAERITGLCRPGVPTRYEDAVGPDPEPGTSERG
ncbi:cupin domain-containing protein [Streptomyces silvisoli]|uniref:Cupin domain-containing protein n=1 Tax=Streptomyces silvisoli TaxID=3034235 RepID=A0ABT5ZDA8_9ACTN|nr:cupin domain-containing protein [Streptomyces silvisoli]MDF3287808.1 cupin domain-containing protein [Streptomyces silvisoli]